MSQKAIKNTKKYEVFLIILLLIPLATNAECKKYFFYYSTFKKNIGKYLK